MMAHHFPSGRPAAGMKLRVKLDRTERELKASEHGIASTEFTLRRAKPGVRRVFAEAGGRKEYARIRVMA